MEHLVHFKMPKPVSINGRSSSITNSFINSIIPVVKPTDGEVKIALEILGMSAQSCHCAYCGDKPTEWDHLRPLVIDQKPTGYISEIQNLVPSCGKCNQSKGNKPWEPWMRGSAKLSPATRGIEGIEPRIDRLRSYEEAQKPTKLDFEEIVGSEIWRQHWQNWKDILDLMRNAQLLATKISTTVKKAHKGEF